MLKISCVSYLNSRPFIEGLEGSSVLREASLSLDVPSECAAKLMDGRADIGLVPVAVLPDLPEAHIVSDFCIGADGPVETVLLLSHVPLEEVTSIIPDSHSRTSVMLAHVLADRYWNIKPEWKAADAPESRHCARLLIGDKTFRERERYGYVTDLAEAWKEFTTLPFVFACWASTRPLPPAFIAEFNAALATGLDQREAMAGKLSDLYPGVDIASYLNHRISYTLDDRKRAGMDLFFRMCGQLAGGVENK